MRITAPYLLGGVGLYAGVAAAVYSRLKSNKCPESCKGHQPQGQPAFDSLADTYDQQIGWDERLMGVLLLRRWLIRQAQVSHCWLECEKVQRHTASSSAPGQLGFQKLMCRVTYLRFLLGQGGTCPITAKQPLQSQ